MLTIWTTTWSRPDMVQLLADALYLTAPRPYRFHVIVQSGGLRREWRNVDAVIERDDGGVAAWVEATRLAKDGDHLHLHDDCIPIRQWSLPSMPCARSVGGGVIGSTFVAWRAPWSWFIADIPAPRARSETMPDWWGDDLRNYAEQAQCEVLLDGDFLHLDKSTIHHPESPYNVAKPLVVAAICRHLGIEQPSPLTANELAFQKGWQPAVASRLPDEHDAAPRAMPSLAQRAATFTQAAARHVAAGMPRTSDEEVERRFAICQQCEHYDGSACRKCGCGISRERRFASKLAWAGERCPVGKWGPEAKS